MTRQKIPTHRPWLVGAATILLATAAAGCGSDDTSEPADQAAADTTEADPAAFCEAAVELGTALRGELVVGLNTAPSPAQAQATLDQFRDSVLPLLASVEETAPAEISGDVSTLTDEIQRAFGTRDPSALQSEDFMAADGAVDEYMLGQCGYQQLEVTGVDYEYEGLPDTLPAEVVAVTFRNEGDELHEVGFARIDDDVTDPVEQVLATPLDQLFTKLDFTGLAIAPPGAADTVFLEFTPGRYGAACFIPQGTTHDTVGTGPPHVTLGMFGEVTVG